MNAKKAKALRRELNYKPSDTHDRAYVVKLTKNPKRPMSISAGRYPGSEPLVQMKSHHSTIELHAACRRFVYQQEKKEALV